MNVISYLYKIIDGVSGQKRSATSLIESGGWYFKQINTYTEASPLVIPQGATSKLVIPVNDMGFSRAKYFDLSYDYGNQKFKPTTLDDVYLANVRLKVKPTNQAGHIDIKVTVPNFAFNPINASTESFTKSANQEHFFSPSFELFIGQETIDGGIEVSVTANGTDVSIYDYSFLITRLYSDKENKD